MSAVTLRPAVPADVPFICALEGRPENAPFVAAVPEAEQRARMDDPDNRYYLINSEAGDPVGFVLITGLVKGAGAVRLRRIVVDAPGRGIGRPAMAALCALVFGEIGARSFWLDVFEDNPRARHVYRAFGFRETGYSHPPSRPRRDGGTAPLIRMEVSAEEYRSTAHSC